MELVKTKEERDEPYQCHLLAPICRDTFFQHPVRTKTCEALAQLPFAMSLYSGSLSLSLSIYNIDVLDRYYRYMVNISFLYLAKGKERLKNII